MAPWHQFRLSGAALARKIAVHLPSAKDSDAWPTETPRHVLGCSGGRTIRLATAVTLVEPVVGVEVSADAAVDGHRWRHVVGAVGVRQDRDSATVTTGFHPPGLTPSTVNIDSALMPPNVLGNSPMERRRRPRVCRS